MLNDKCVQHVLPIKWAKKSVDAIEEGWRVSEIQSILKSMNRMMDKNLLLKMQYDFEKKLNQYIKKD